MRLKILKVKPEAELQKSSINTSTFLNLQIFFKMLLSWAFQIKDRNEAPSLISSARKHDFWNRRLSIVKYLVATLKTVIKALL